MALHILVRIDADGGLLHVIKSLFGPGQTYHKLCNPNNFTEEDVFEIVISAILSRAKFANQKAPNLIYILVDT